MSLTSANLVGYLRAEFSKSAKYRLRLFILQLAAAMPAAIAVLILDHNGNVLYALAFLSIALLALWWFVNAQYTRIRGAGQAALRGALLLGSLNETLPQSPSHCAIGFLSHPTLGSMGRVCSCRLGTKVPKG